MPDEIDGTPEGVMPGQAGPEAASEPEPVAVVSEPAPEPVAAPVPEPAPAYVPAPEYAAAYAPMPYPTTLEAQVSAPAPAHHHRWRMWVAAAAIAVVFFAAGMFAGGLTNRFGARGFRGGFGGVVQAGPGARGFGYSGGAGRFDGYVPGRQ